MMVAASRTFIALGYDTSPSDSQIPDDQIEDIEACIAWCSQLDRSMSLLLGRSSLLPKSATPLRLSLRVMDDGIRWKLQFIHLSLDLTHIQGLVSFVARDAAKRMEWKDLEPLHDKLNDLWKRLDTVSTPLKEQKLSY